MSATDTFWIVVGIALVISVGGTLLVGPVLRRRRLESRRDDGLPDDD